MGVGFEVMRIVVCLEIVGIVMDLEVMGITVLTGASVFISAPNGKKGLKTNTTKLPFR